MKLLHLAGLPLLLLVAPLLAQQVRFIDLTTTTQRVTLRVPPAPPVEDGFGVGGASSSVGDCGVGARDPRSLTVYLQNVIVRDGDSTRPFEIEFKVLNTGTVPLELPVSQHLADLQPSDASAAFTYMNIALAAVPVQDRSAIGFVQLYGRPEVPDSMITLNPGEWLTVEARVEFHLNVPPAGNVKLTARSWIQRTTVYPHPGGHSTAVMNICLPEKPTSEMLVHRN
jgi:hypothetical protein